jgi:imidazolonepropionase-like amidohydrolase
VTTPLAVAAAAALLVASQAFGQDLLIRGGTVRTVSGDVLDGADVLITGGKIAAVGNGLDAPADTRVIDAAGKQVCPGFVDAHSHLGLAPGELVERRLPASAEAAVIDAFWAKGDAAQRAVSSGVTTLLLSPGDQNPISGPSAAVKLGAGTVIDRAAAVKISLSASALMRDRKPTSMPALLDMVRGSLTAAGETDDALLRRAAEGTAPVLVLCDGLAEVERAVGLADEFGLRASVVLYRVPERLPAMLAGTDVSVVLPPLSLTPADRDLAAPRRLVDAGVKIAFSSLGPATDAADLRTSAALAVAAGLHEDDALRALTLGAAEIIGVDDRTGSIEVGKDGDLLIVAGHPLDLSRSIETVVVDGRVIYEREAK